MHSDVVQSKLLSEAEHNWLKLSCLYPELEAVVNTKKLQQATVAAG